MATVSDPKTLLEAVRYFADDDVGLAFVAALHPGWENGPIQIVSCKNGISSITRAIMAVPKETVTPQEKARK